MLRLEREGTIATVLLDRPEKLNAVDRSLWPLLEAAFRDLDADESVRCVVLRGAGSNFAAGADIAEFPAVRTGSAAAREFAVAMHAALRAIAGCRHPTLALIEGVCVGGGLELAACCDLRIAAASSRFGVPIARIGVTMAAPEVSLLLELVGAAGLLSILLEGRVFGADEALALGLLTHVVPDARVEEEALLSAQRIAQGAPLVHRWHKRIIRRLRDPRPLAPDEEDGALETFDSADFREGIAAFLAKRKPVFEGK